MTTDIETLKALRERCRVAAADDDAVLEHLSEDICFAFGLPGTMGRGTPGYPTSVAASLDAALALVERLLPGCCGVLGFGPPDGPSASIGPPGDPSTAPAGLVIEFESGATPALALIAAALSARIAEMEGAPCPTI